MAAAVLSAVTGLTAPAQTSDGETVLRPVASAYTIEIGSAHLRDTYLTPLKYEGQNFALGYERFQAMGFDPERWVMRLNGRLSLGHTENPGRNATMWDLDFEVGWAMMRRVRVSQVAGLQLMGGGHTGVDLGALYLARNGNNPVSAKASWTIGATGAAVYNFKIRRLPVTLRYQATLPITGVFFSPDYGELYYEIYLGNHKGLTHGAWWGNYFRLDQLLTADLRFGATGLRLGYHFDFLSTKVNNIVTRRATHSLSVGISGEWLSVGRDGRLPAKARIISSIY